MEEELKKLKQEVFDYARFRLGDQMIDIHLDPEHYETAYKHALGIYRQRAQNAHEAAYLFLELQKDTDTYILPSEVTAVRQVFRRTFGAVGGDSNSFDPFESAVINTYILNIGGQGGLLTWELYSQKLELASRLFGGYLNFNFNPSTKKIQFMRKFLADGETILLWAYMLKPEHMLLNDLMIKQWIMDFVYSSCKEMLGQAYSRYSSIAGPNGGTSMNGAELKSEAKAEMEKLIDDLRRFVDGSAPLGFITR